MHTTSYIGLCHLAPISGDARAKFESSFESEVFGAAGFCGDLQFTRDVRNECECVNECEKMPPGKMNRNFFAASSFFNLKKALES